MLRSINRIERFLKIFSLDFDNADKTMCSTCGKMFSKQYIAKHTDICSNKDSATLKSKTPKVDKNLFCDNCTRHFINQDHFNNHKCAHLKCDKCDAEFIRRRNLENHLRGHAGEQLFPCDQCEGLFLSR